MPSLDSYPRPNVAVDLVLLTLHQTSDTTRPVLGVVVLRQPDGTAVLPGRFVRERERVAATVGQLFAEKLGQPARRRELWPLDVHDDPDRDPRGWVLSLPYVSGLPARDAIRMTAARPEIGILPVRGAASRRRRVTSQRLAFDHDEMVTTAVRRWRRRYERGPDPLHLLRPPFTLTELRHVHEAVLDAPLMRDTFNRRMERYLTKAVGKDGRPTTTSEKVGRPAVLYEPLGAAHRDPEAAGPFPLPRTEA